MAGVFCIIFVTAFPCFYSILQSQGAQRLVYSGKTADGYIAVGSLSSDWGGLPGTVVYNIDEYGMVVSQTVTEYFGEPADATDLQGGVAVVCDDTAEETSRLAFFSSSGEEQWLALFPEQYFQNPAVGSFGTDAVLAGNVSGSVRAAMINSTGGIVWNTGYPSVDFSVCDICSYGTQIFVLGVHNDPGWQSSLCILHLNSSGEMSELYTLFSSEGRILPVALEADSRGIFVLMNAITEAGNNIGETWLVKLNYSMELQWTAVVSGASWERGTDLAVLTGGDIAVCGWTNSIPISETNRSDLWIARFTENGELVWNIKYGTSSPDYGLAVSAVSDGGMVVSGCVTESLYQGWLLKTDSLGLVEPQGLRNPLLCEFSAVPLNNPVASGFLSFTLNSVESAVVEVVMYDMSGRVFAALSSAIVPGENLINMPVDAPPGVYSIRVSSGINESVFRTVVCGGVK